LNASANHSVITSVCAVQLIAGSGKFQVEKIQKDALKPFFYSDRGFTSLDVTSTRAHLAVLGYGEPRFAASTSRLQPSAPEGVDTAGHVAAIIGILSGR
jgi:hypothetical protein